MKVAVRGIISGMMMAVALLLSFSSYAQNVVVEAGQPTTICYGSFLDLSTLGASITGAVSDGTWFSSGSGLFLPENTAFTPFSIGTFYQPGQDDLWAGSFVLTLVSDDPDGIGPEVQVNDQVTITIMSAPALSCSGEINVSLDETCSQTVDVFMLVPNPVLPSHLYEVTLFDSAGDTIQDNTLTNEQIGQVITYTVGHSCTANSCSGTITVSDNIAPFLNCINATIDCSQSADPDDLGLPIPFFATATPLSSSSYSVDNFDACGMVLLSYTDDVTAMGCSQGLSSTIARQWTATDINGNSTSCTQTINVELLGIESVTVPPNYDNVAEPALECDGPWVALPSGNPSPETTGMPTFSGCTNMEATYSDVVFDHCGAGFKVLRKWLVIDWCTTDHIDVNQIIEVTDTQAPVFACAPDVTIGTDPYVCESLPFEAIYQEPVLDCSEWDYSVQILDGNNVDQSAAYVDGYTVEGMPIGTYTLVYELTDECGNMDICEQLLTVVDDKTPFAICDQYTQIAIQSTGSARLFATSIDESSYDNCGVASMSVQRMTDNCGSGTPWGPYVNFCCEDVGDTVMVRFQVTDYAGLSNTCMVEVLIEDKIPPVIICPTDLTISCDYVFDADDLSEFGVIRENLNDVQQVIIYDNHNNGVAGSDGYFSDNCHATVTESSTVNVDCGQGLITRNFTVTDDYGNTDQCQQLITIVNDNPFTGADIVWPANYTDIGCDTLQATADVTGSPILATDRCADVASSHYDQTFNLGGDACVKILRYWTVVDWCQFDSNTGDGTWQYIQEIKLLNDIAPVFASCGDTSLCEYESCDVHFLNLTVVAEDDCTDAEYLEYTWALDLGADGAVDANGSGSTIARVVALGSHTVQWTATDGCGNTASCSQNIAIRDCKLPTPYCHGGIATTLMPSSGSLTVRATDFDLGSTDNCTAAEDLVFSFSTEVTDSTKVLTCDDIPNGVAAVVPLQMWVTDAEGNQDYCSVELLLQDNQESCTDGDLEGRLAGTVKTWTDVYISDVQVGYHTYLEGYSDTVATNADGVYSAANLPLYLDYGLKPHYEGGPKKDVNTIDLIAIQRHILGIEPLASPYDLIAADITDNGRIQPSDLLILRKHILGILPVFPKSPKWKFVPATFVFADENDPYDFDDSLQVEYLTAPIDTLDWIAVRMGNVNGIFSILDEKPTSESRSNSSVALTLMTTLQADGTYSTVVQASEDLLLDGLQLSLQADRGQVQAVSSPFLSEHDYALVDGRLHIVYAELGREIAAGSTLFTLVSDSKDIALTAHLQPMLIGEEVLDIILTEAQESAVTAHVPELELLENPVSEAVRFTVSGESREGVVQVSIYHIGGALVHKATYMSDGVVSISLADLADTGLYILQVTVGTDTFVKQFVKI